MGIDCDPGWRPAQADRYFRARNVDQDDRPLDLHRRAREEMAGERFHPVDAARYPRLEERANDFGLAWTIEREARPRQNEKEIFLCSTDFLAGAERACGASARASQSRETAGPSPE